LITGSRRPSRNLRARVTNNPVTLAKGLFQARCNETVDAFDAPQQRIHLLTTAQAICQCHADLWQLLGGCLTQPEWQALADDAVLESIDGCLCA